MKTSNIHFCTYRIPVLFFCVLFFKTQPLQAQCAGFPATTADANCAGGTALSNNANINGGTSYSFCGPTTTVYNFTGINLAGGTLRLCGNTNISGNFNSGIIVVSCGSTVNFTSGLTLNSNVGIVNYGIINVTGDLTFQNGGNYVYNEPTTSRLYVTGNINYPANNGTNAYLKNNGYISVGNNFSALDGGFTCFGTGSIMETKNLKYIQSCGGPANRFTYGSVGGTAIIRYTGTATLNAVFTASTNYNIYQAAGATPTLNCGSTWGSATVTTSAPAVIAPSGQQTCPSKNCFTVLAETFLYFSGAAEADRVRISWSVAAGGNGGLFTLQRSMDGATWGDMATLNGDGNNGQPGIYQVYDESPRSGIDYYRLKVTDPGGNYSYSIVIAVWYEAKKGSFSVYPNPSRGNEINLKGLNDGNLYSLSIYNSQGQQIYSGAATSTHPVINVPLAKGIYIFVARNGQDLQRARYIRM